MTKNHCLAKHIVDASLNKLISITTYNAESVGKNIELINPKNLSQMCSGYGRIVKENYRKEHIVVLSMVLFLIGLIMLLLTLSDWDYERLVKSISISAMEPVTLISSIDQNHFLETIQKILSLC